MRRLLLAALAVAALTAAAASSSAAQTAYTALTPGGLTPLTETVDVNVVYVGLDPDTAAVEAELATTGSPRTRSKLFYGLEDEANLGITYTYDYHHYATSDAWEDGFFAALKELATLKPLTAYQQLYNEQAGNALDVTDNNWIEAVAVEKLLIDRAPEGVDTRRPTIFFVNWYGRDDFVFHVYTKTDEPDPDTGYNFGELRDSRKLVAWGGTTPDDEETGLGGRGDHRVWFYDLSAGPEAWGGSWNVDDADLDGDEVPDYRIPVIWEYGSYRPADALASDLGKVVRYVGVDLLFTSSPLYPPYYRANRIPDRVNLDVNTVEGWPGVDASEQYIKPGLFISEVEELPAGWENTFTQDYQDLPFSGDWRRCYRQWVRDNRICFNDVDRRFYLPFANLFLAAAHNTSEFLDGTLANRYEAGHINYAIGERPQSPGLLGYADDNWLDGTQSGIFSFVYPDAIASGYGLTTTMIHEYGHHSSLSHPHDGYDPPTGVDFEPTGPYFFAWLGDESNSMMSYIDLNWDFSQFDRDNSARHHAAGYAVIANRVAATLVDKPEAAAKLVEADAQLHEAQMAFATHRYTRALANARAAYRAILEGASLARVHVPVLEPSTWTLAARVRGQGKRTKLYANDLEVKANLKRMLP
jgi:hypothetical protein